jgi:hypothetical protein
VVKRRAGVSAQYVAEHVILHPRIKVLAWVLEWTASLCGCYLMLLVIFDAVSKGESPEVIRCRLQRNLKRHLL